MLVVLQQHVVLGRVLADEVRLQDQRLGLALGNDPLDIADIGQHERRGPVPAVVAAVEVAPYAVLEHLRLADVDDLSLGVLHDVHARQCGELGEAPLDMFADLDHGTLQNYKLI